MTPGYLTTLGVPVLEGRDFTATDVQGAPVVLVNETLVKTFFKGQTAVGRRLKPGGGPQVPWFTIVGVVRDVKQGGVAQKTGTEIYFLADQAPRLTNSATRSMNIVIRSALPFESLAANVRRVVGTMDPTLPLVKMRTMDEVFAETIARPRFLAVLLMIAAGLALALAALGTYGILAYSVSQRRKEIGIHMAMGATRQRVMTMVLGQGMALAAAGLVAGVAASFLLTRFLQTQLFNVKPSDPGTLATVIAFIGTVALVACFVPAHRATRVDPMVVLRDE